MTQIDERIPACPEKWGACPVYRARHECKNNRGHAGSHVCGWCETPKP
jgi:hypothetical protein